MAWVNAQGAPVATQSQTIQLDIPCEAATNASVAAVNWIAVVLAVIGLLNALKSGDPMAISAAVQALIKAFTG